MKIVLIFGLMTLSTFCYAKRIAPKTVRPVSNAGLRYEVLHWSTEAQKMKQNGGYIRVVNLRNGLPLCTKQVYETKYQPDLEQDVQDNFITSLKVEKNQLIIESEKLAPLKRPFAHFCDE